ncbi:hypothetical protein FA15DRAFT_706298 [Coprinopsis marcescibilis]|uniref:Nephrocystin 3-like N-terminal domain-containing protein n=1 Tax=Coprinopsis marcescibilis TaxID=230819 RepID=A0A5C3KQ20_COPMA|nr:hypothetical protein FA15DRAFT_706298 [Coprinopsis marcescibilis]
MAPFTAYDPPVISHYLHNFISRHTMGAGLSHALDLREKRHREGWARKAITGVRADPEPQEGSSVNTGPIAHATGSIDANQGSSTEGNAHVVNFEGPTTLNSYSYTVNTGVSNQVGPSIEGGILSHAHGVRFEGPTAFNSTSYHYTSIYNHPSDVPEHDVRLFEKIVEWISDTNYHAIQSDNLRKRAEGTGEWVFDDPKISKWLEGVMGILWGVGMHRSSSILLQKAKANKHICIAFAFSRYTDQFTSEKVLGGLLRQVVEDHPSTLQYAKPIYNYHSLRKTRPAQKELLAILRAIFTSDLFDEWYCTIDDLDEALANTQIDMLDALSNMPVNLLIMSRPLLLLKELVPEATFIEIMVHDADIEILIEEKLCHTKALRNLLEKED